MEQVFFVHIPSSAGSTIWYVLEKVYGRRRTFRRLPTRREKFDKIAADPSLVARCDALGGHVPLGQAIAIAPERKRIAFVRDPVARAKSAYARKIRKERWRPRPDLGDADILRFVRTMKRDRMWNRYFRPPGPEREFDLDATMRFVSENVDAMCLTEEFDRSLFLAARVLGWSGVPNYVAKNIDGTAKRQSLDPEIEGELHALLSHDREIYDQCHDLHRAQVARFGAEVGEAELSAYRAANQARLRRLTLVNFGRNPYAQTGKANRFNLWPF